MTRSAGGWKKIDQNKELKIRISARNCIKEKAVEIKEGSVSTEVAIETAAGERPVSAISTTSVKILCLMVGCEACAVIKDAVVMVAVND